MPCSPLLQNLHSKKLHANIKPKEENINFNLNQLPYTLMAIAGDKLRSFSEKHLGI
jgi:hypothetical protein